MRGGWMTLCKKFMPEYYFETFEIASSEFLLSIGVKGIILDVDNTLEPYENPKPTEKVIQWFDSLKKAGIKAAIVSNNGRERIDLFNAELGLVAYCKSGKPKKKNVLKALSDIGVHKEDAIFMGDQIFTDVWAAHNAGIRAILVPPIRDKRDILTRFKRLLERPILNKYRKLKEK